MMNTKVKGIDSGMCELHAKPQLAIALLTYIPPRCRKERRVRVCCSHAKRLLKYVEWCNGNNVKPNIVKWVADRQRENLIAA